MEGKKGGTRSHSWGPKMCQQNHFPNDNECCCQEVMVTNHVVCTWVPLDPCQKEVNTMAKGFDYVQQPCYICKPLVHLLSPHMNLSMLMPKAIMMVM